MDSQVSAFRNDLLMNSVKFKVKNETSSGWVINDKFLPVNIRLFESQSECIFSNPYMSTGVMRPSFPKKKHDKKQHNHPVQQLPKQSDITLHETNLNTEMMPQIESEKSQPMIIQQKKLIQTSAISPLKNYSQQSSIKLSKANFTESSLPFDIQDYLIQKRFVQHTNLLSKSPRAPLRCLLDSGETNRRQNDKLNAYIISESYQDRLFLINQKTQINK